MVRHFLYFNVKLAVCEVFVEDINGRLLPKQLHFIFIYRNGEETSRRDLY